MTVELETWPKKVGRGWNTSDRMRFRSEERAQAHQARVDDPDDEAGTHDRSPSPAAVAWAEAHDQPTRNDGSEGEEE